MNLRFVDVIAVLGILSISGCAPTSPPTVMRAVAPVFPAVALAARAEGAVTVDTTINSSGDVVNARIAEVVGPVAIYHQKWYEQLAREWRFSSSNSRSSRLVRVKFIFRLMPTGTPPQELGAVFSPPYEVEVRAERPTDVHSF
jgi:hypothetical protein